MPLRVAASELLSRFRAARSSRPLLALAVALVALAVAPASALAQFQLGLEDPLLSQATPTTANQEAWGTVHQAAASTVRIQAIWASVAPTGSVMPAGFDPSNPADPLYHWTALDAAVRAAADHHVRPLLNILTAPAWAQAPGKPATDATLYPTSPWDPSAVQFGQFALALATRYSGHFADPLNPGQDLPRVKLYEIWNEPNLASDLLAPDLVDEYRSLLNAGYAAIKSVHGDNVVSIGGLAPVGGASPSVSPLKFAAALLCLRRTGTHFVRSKTCPVRAHFDALAMHPYSLAATPTKHAYKYDDVLVADMGKLRTLLRAAEKLHTAAPRINYGLWVTEWAWFSNPPNPVIGDPDPVAARYTAYGMYEMWRSGVSLVIWLLIRYEPVFLDAPPAGIYGGGLFTTTGKPTLKLRAFEFPVTAAVKHGHGLVWGRAPVTRRTHVFVQHQVGHRWRTIGTLRTAADGVFELHFSARGNGTYRARIKHGLTSVPYNSRPIPGKRIHAFNGG
jgi:hypothetical protein